MNNLIGLEVGQKLKIKDIGILLGKDIPEKLQTNTKKSWLREFDTYCKYHKEKVSYVIDEIYESQIEKVDDRGKHNNHKTTPVSLVDSEGNVIETFKSIIDAAE